MQNKYKDLTATWMFSFLALGISLPFTATYAEDGVTDNEIMIGGVMDLEGRSSGLGLGMKAGIEAALEGQTVAGRKVRFWLPTILTHRKNCRSHPKTYRAKSPRIRR